MKRVRSSALCTGRLTPKEIFMVLVSASVGRRKMRWEDGVDQDMRILGVKNLKKVALNRDEWAKFLKKAKTHQGLSSQ